MLDRDPDIPVGARPGPVYSRRCTTGTRHCPQFLLAFLPETFHIVSVDTGNRVTEEPGVIDSVVDKGRVHSNLSDAAVCRPLIGYNIHRFAPLSQWHRAGLGGRVEYSLQYGALSTTMYHGLYLLNYVCERVSVSVRALCLEECTALHIVRICCAICYVKIWQSYAYILYTFITCDISC